MELYILNRTICTIEFENLTNTSQFVCRKLDNLTEPGNFLPTKELFFDLNGKTLL